jgi:predicted dinucleotide-binding enzyme
MLADRIPSAKVVKPFNAILAPDLEELSRTGANDPRRALPIAGDDAGAKEKVSQLHEDCGLDVVDVGPLSEGGASSVISRPIVRGLTNSS